MAIPLLDKYLALMGDGVIPPSTVAAIALEYLSEGGSLADFDELPLEIRTQIGAFIKSYEEKGVWYSVSSEGLRDMSEVAQKFIERFSSRLER
ncbi:hypothetical protein [Lysobacter enzymogenes]|uniref:hypothetical protein n=1 Tax=Lysobacter enzymogenes TaxID=69 RepID=UPI001A96F911|nr:hypothetical protein [Lysobacter enzymogenes]QQP94345.1 hypothetical protein JHW38_13795 [Lysobacter enzymogenes]